MRASPDDILGMAFFARVVEARSFSDAARTLGVSKSAVSARVARLEERLGVRLLHRTTRRLALTADGVRLYESCARLVAEADQAAEVAAGASAVPRGTVRVHAPPLLAEPYLIAPIAEFMRAYPGVRVELHLGDRVLDATLEGLDVAFVVAGRLADSPLTTRRLADVRAAVCAAPSYLKRKGIPFRPQDLVLHDCLSHSNRHGTDDPSFQTEEGAVSMTNLSNLVADDGRFLREAALAGLGIVILPELSVVDDLAAGRLHRILDDFQTIELSVHALHPHGRLAPAGVRAFLEHVVASFREPPWVVRAPVVTPARRRPTGHRFPMTAQDARRLEAVAALYEDADASGSAQLREIIGRAKATSASKIPRTTVTMNSRVRVRDDDGSEREISLAYPWDAGRGKVSVMSPLGRALLGAAVGGKLADDGRNVTIASIPYQPEAAGDHHL